MSENTYSNESENNSAFIKRLYIYQKERFPLISHGIMVVAFSFSAISYARICRGAPGFIDISTFLVGVFTTVGLFLLVRIFDEFKDARDDAAYRPELPVPRGLVTLRELRNTGIVVAVLQISLNLIFFPKMLWLYAMVILYLTLMGKEFFIPDWLKKHQFWYITSHMFIIPLIDIYASGLDWFIEGTQAPVGLIFFFAVSYMNGVVLEVGRKIRAPEMESSGVLTYTSMLGTKRAIYLWLVLIMSTFTLSILASHYAGYGYTAFIALIGILCICSVPAILFLYKPMRKTAKTIELSSFIWTIAMYLTLGGVPMLHKLLFS